MKIGKNRFSLFFTVSILTLFTIGTILTLGIGGNNKLSCTSDASLNGCIYKDMKTYNQRIYHSMACGPTAASILTSAMTFGGVNYYIGSYRDINSSTWTYNKFISKPVYDRIDNWASLLSTTEEGGTRHEVMQSRISLRVGDFPRANYFYKGSSEVRISDVYLKNRILDNVIPMIRQGKYNKTCVKVNGANYCSYEREGGHYITLNGYYTNDAGTTDIIIYDPWGNSTGELTGKIYNRSITVRANENGYQWGWYRPDTRPYGDNTTFLYLDSKEKYRIIDNVIGIDTN